ncbi:ATP-binding cassette domain-containing protein [Novosphingobium sp. TH158]|uniref:ATP-binding cassette domain-containing protein n=1 Tax=Novosphingobium sp. TH158 TaxID=2067455 RepID=UPI0013046645|nr:ATP-binding cassette domain-containing protein [Novosphingobium sp. TH158]
MASPSRSSTLAQLGPALPRRRLALLAVVSLAASLSEGLGLLLLVPLMEVATNGPQGGLAAALASWGLPRRLDGLLVLFVVLVSLRSLLVQYRMVLETRARIEVTSRLRDRLLRALFHADWRFLSSLRQGELLSLATSAVDRAGNSLQFLLGLFSALVTLAAMLVAALLIAPLPAIAVGAGGALALALYAGLRRRAGQEGEALEARFTGFYGFFIERFGALRIIKSLGKAEDEAALARKLAAGVANAQLRYQSGLALGQVVLQSGAALALAGAVWLALTRWNVPLAALLPLVALFARSVPLLAAVQASWQHYAHNAAAIAEINARVTQALSRAEPEWDGISPAPALHRDIRLEGASLFHAGRAVPALDKASLIVPAGSVCFLTGPSGAGKSTLADLLAGLIQPDEGRALVDGVPLEGAALAAWRHRVAYVQQEPVLFDASLRENLLWAAPDADEGALRACLSRGAADFVLDLPDGLDTRMGPGGRQLSGGERQRIVLARALLRDPALLILDEATSALDRENEARIVEAIAALKGKVTVVIIGHGGRLAELADQTVRLENGRVLG